MISGLAQWVKDPMLLWPWYRSAVAAPVRPLAWELPYAPGEALRREKKGLGDRVQEMSLSFLEGRLGSWS